MSDGFSVSAEHLARLEQAESRLHTIESLLSKLLRDGHVEYERAALINGKSYGASLKGNDPHDTLEITPEEDACICHVLGIEQETKVINTEAKPGEVVGADGIARRKKVRP